MGRDSHMPHWKGASYLGLWESALLPTPGEPPQWFANQPGWVLFLPFPPVILGQAPHLYPDSWPVALTLYSLSLLQVKARSLDWSDTSW